MFMNYVCVYVFYKMCFGSLCVLPIAAVAEEEEETTLVFYSLGPYVFWFSYLHVGLVRLVVGFGVLCA